MASDTNGDRITESEGFPDTDVQQVHERDTGDAEPSVFDSVEPPDCVDIDPPEFDESGAADPEDVRTGKLRLWVKIMIAVVAAIVVLSAVIWEAYYGRPGNGAAEQNSGKNRENREDYPPAGRSEIQDMLSDLEWVTPAFIPINEYSRPGYLIGEVNSVVIHYVGNPGTTALQNRNYFANLEITGETYASSNFIIGLEGEILQCVPVDEIAYASNIRNEDSVSIELCHPDTTGWFTDETYESVVRLTSWLCIRYGLTRDDVIRHFDVTGKECPRYFVENEDAWDEFRNDVAQAIETNAPREWLRGAGVG